MTLCGMINKQFDHGTTRIALRKRKASSLQLLTE